MLIVIRYFRKSAFDGGCLVPPFRGISGLLRDAAEQQSLEEPRHVAATRGRRGCLLSGNLGILVGNLGEIGPVAVPLHSPHLGQHEPKPITL